MSRRPWLPFVSTALLAGAVAVMARGQQPPASQPPPQPAQQPVEVAISITGERGSPPRFAVPDFVAQGGDADAAAIGRTIAQVLWDDLEFEREFYLIPRDTYASIPPARSAAEVPFDRWRELGADGVVVGFVRKTGSTLSVQVRVVSVKDRQSVFQKEYSGSAANPRLYAHTIADEVHQQQRGLRGVARTKLTFSSDRDGERMAGPVEGRNIKEIYLADYDGANQRRITVNRALNIFPVWSADGRAIAYTSYRRGFPDVFVSYIYQGTFDQPAKGTDRVHNWLASWSPDGTRIAFTSNRAGNAEIYVMSVDGSGLRRLTNHPAVDSTPTWSPAGNEIAFTSDRSGVPQIYVVSADGGAPRRITFESYADRPTWAPAPYNEIAYSARSGPGLDIRIYEVAEGRTRQVTFGEGSNESPAYAPNGRHLAFTSTRRGGRTHVFVIGRDGRGLKQITTSGNNYTPDWSK